MSLKLQEFWDRYPEERINVLRSFHGQPPGEESSLLTSPGHPHNTLLIVCLGFRGATEEDEPILVTQLIVIASRQTNPLPMASEDPPRTFLAKTLISLSLYHDALEKRCRTHAAPPPAFYRGRSKNLLSQMSKAHQALCSHHERWESFLNENLA